MTDMYSFDIYSGFLIPPYLTFPQAPLRSRTVGFPESGSDLGFPPEVFPKHVRLKRWLAYTPTCFGLPQGSSFKDGSSDARR